MNFKVSCKSQNVDVMPSESWCRPVALSEQKKSFKHSGTMLDLDEHCASPKKDSKRASLFETLYRSVTPSACHFKLKGTDGSRGSLCERSSSSTFDDHCASSKKSSKRSSLCETIYQAVTPTVCHFKVKDTSVVETGSKRSSITAKGTMDELDDHCSSIEKPAGNCPNATVKLSSGKFRKVTTALAAVSVLFVVLHTEVLLQFNTTAENLAQLPQSSIRASITPDAVVNASELKASHHEDKWLPFINNTLAEPIENREDTIRDIVDDADPAMIQRFNLFLRAYAPDDNASAAPRIPESAEPRDQDRKTRDIKALMQSSNSNQYHVLTEIIKKSEPELQSSVLEFVRSAKPSKRRFIEEETNAEMQKVEQSEGPENFLIFSREEWHAIEQEMKWVKDECSEVYKIAKTLHGDAGKTLREVVDAFMHIQKIVFIDEEELGTGPSSPKIHYFHFYQNHFEKFQMEIDKESDLLTKRALLEKYKNKLKLDWESFIDSRVRTFLALALGHNELQQTIGDNLKAIQEHPGFPQEAKTKVEAIYRKHFMSINAKCRFLKFLTIGDASGDFDERHAAF